MTKKPVILMILDGFGYSEQTEHNAIHLAKTDFWDKLWNNFPKTLISCCGEAVGLPDGQIGNSEVGHLHISSGRIIPQSLKKINDSIKSQSIDSIKIFNNVYNSKRVHLIGLLSDGGVHSHIEHFQALISQLSPKIPEIYIHAFLDGRDTPPKSAKSAIQEISPVLSEQITLASVCGRYYAMDRNQNWDRTKTAYEMLLGSAEFHADNAISAIEQAYKRDESDEFIKPTICTNKQCAIQDDDIVIFLNFRADRARQLTQVFVDQNFSHFPTKKINLHEFITMTEYEKNYSCSVLFPPTKLTNTLGEIVANAKLKQLRIAETEKYAHVTYFFNGGLEKKYHGEDRILLQSPKIATYDLQPEMSAKLITEQLLKNMEKYDLIVCNFANADMVGHTGNLPATIKAIETLDQCLNQIYTHLEKLNGWMLITADHGNAENMYNSQSMQPHTAHTKNLVPCIVTNKLASLTKTSHGSLIDIAPTILELMGLSKPKEMTGEALFTVNK